MKENKNSKVSIAKNFGIQQNVCIRVIDEVSGKVVREHRGHNSATNSLLFGIGHHLIGNFTYNEGQGLNSTYEMLHNFVPNYISLGTMGLINQHQDSHGLPAGIGDSLPDISDPEYQALLEAYNQAQARLQAAKDAMENECPYWPWNDSDACKNCTNCATRIAAKKQELEDAKIANDEAYDALVSYSEAARFKEYVLHRPGYGADGYDSYLNNSRKYAGLGYAYTSYDATSQYNTGDQVTQNGILYVCKQTTPYPAGPFNPSNWERAVDSLQPSLNTTINLELISPSFPRQQITYRDLIPEYQAELPMSIDVVFSAMISTGALKQFRPEGQDYLFITEAGLWSKQSWNNSGENGLLAGYRILPPNEDNWDMSVEANRQMLKESIIRVDKNQVVQVVWKIQIASIDNKLQL